MYLFFLSDEPIIFDKEDRRSIVGKKTRQRKTEWYWLLWVIRGHWSKVHNTEKHVGCTQDEDQVLSSLAE